MKKLILLSAVLVGMAMQATAQNVNRESLLARIQKMETATKDPKKEGKAVTWINVAKSYVDAAVEPTKDLYVGMVPMMIPAQPTSKTDTEWVFPYFTVRLENDQVVGWYQTQQVREGAIEAALKALTHAYELEPGKAPSIKVQLQRISDFEAQYGNALNNMGRFAEASRAFELAAAAEANPAFGTPDLSRVYYAGMTSVMGGSEDPTLFARAEKFLTQARAAGYEDEKGMIYYFLYHSYFGQREADKSKLTNAKEALLTGLDRFPENTDLFESLINLYTTQPGMGDPSELIANLDKKIEANPTDVNLRFSRAQIFVNLKDYDQAVSSLDDAIKIEPDSYPAWFFAGYYLIMKADMMQTEADSKSFTSVAESNASRDAILGVYARSVPYLERAHELDPSQENPVLLLKNVLYRLRDQPGFTDAYKKYE